jgi:bifunctional UDP-N-acetylglucosamine pyrophosphorylase/glucosamine-1-phosphate N-acetyltransferase
MENNSNANTICVKFVILAAGKGTRMNEGRPSLVPKALIPLGGRPMISYILETISKISSHMPYALSYKIKNKDNLQLKTYSLQLEISKPILVIGYKGEMIKKEFGDSCNYVWQRQRLGTGHAARLAVDYIFKNSSIGDRLTSIESSTGDSISDEKPKTNNFSIDDNRTTNNLVFILQGDDSAFYKPETLFDIIKNHIKNNATLTFITTRLPDVKDLGRVLRDKNGSVCGIAEKENMTPEIEKINEINCGGYLFNLDWGVKAIKKIKKHLKGGKEYPLPDIIKLALDNDLAMKQFNNGSANVIAYEIPSEEWRGINSPDQLIIAEKKIKVKNN